MTSHRDVARSWANGGNCKGSRMFCEDGVLYSYGHHFPICAEIRGITLFNTDKYSQSTSKHQSIARSVCGSVVECSTDELQRAIRHPDEAIIIRKKVYPSGISEALDMLRDVCKEEGMKRFPRKKIREMLNTSIFLERL